MAKTLLESLQNKMKAQRPTQAAPGQTQAVQRLQAARTGKAVGQRGPAISSLGEKMARQQSDNELGRIEAQGQLQQEQQLQQSAEQTQAAEQQRAEISQSREQTRQAAEQRMSELQQQLEQGRDELDFKEYAANLEQQGFLARLNTDQYVSRLQREGQVSRLENDLNFREEMKRAVLDFATEDLYDQLDFSRMVDLDNDQFKRELAQFDLDTAMRIANESAKSQQIQDIYSGGTSIVSGGLDYLDSQDKKDDTDGGD